MRTNTASIAATVALCCFAHAKPALAQLPTTLSLSEARASARSASPDLKAAQHALDAARARERQAAAFSNPELLYSAERTSRDEHTNAQHIVAVEQRVELGGQRGARRNAASLRRRAAESRVESARGLVDFEVARAYALALSADRRAALARRAAAAFTEAARISARRLATGDVSVYADRRLRLEAARYAALEGEANLLRRSTRIALSSLIAASTDSVGPISAVLTDSVPVAVSELRVAALRALAIRNRADYRAISLEREALAADARLAAAERMSTPLASAGFKSEKSAGISGSLNGFAAVISLPLPVWDRRAGAIEAASAEARRAAAEEESMRRRILHEVAVAYDALRSAEQQRLALAPLLGQQSAAALRSAQIAYDEGEITLLEWLDAVRAYHEAESSYSTLLSEYLIRYATLERAVSSPLNALDDTSEVPPATEEESLNTEND